MFPEGFLQHINSAAVCLALGVVVMFLAWRIIDYITPGCLSKELLGVDRPPNVALAIVVASMFVSFSLIVAAAIL